MKYTEEYCPDLSQKSVNLPINKCQRMMDGLFAISGINYDIEKHPVVYPAVQ
jgi:hypothetical protein